MNMLYAQSEQYLNEARDHLSEYKAYPWLLEYWRSNRDKMHLAGDAEERAAFLNQMFVEHKLSGPRAVTSAQAETFNDKEQQYFAEGCYMDILGFLNNIKKNFKLTNLNCIMMDENYITYPLFNAGDEELTKEEEYALGQDWPLRFIQLLNSGFWAFFFYGEG